MANIIKLGSLYLDGQPVEIGADYAPGQSIEVGKTIPGKEISWVVVNEMLIADRCILTNVSWNDLNACNLIFGKCIIIEGYHYQIRLLQIGTDKAKPNEWDAAVEIVGEDNRLWNWKWTYFWGQETPACGPIANEYTRAYRGYSFARTWSWAGSGLRRSDVGFRPVLVPLNTKQFTPALLGQRVMIWGGQNIVNGYLEQVTDYDVLLSNWHGSVLESQSCGWIITGGKLLVDRNSIVGAQNQKEA